MLRVASLLGRAWPARADEKKGSVQFLYLGDAKKAAPDGLKVTTRTGARTRRPNPRTVSPTRTGRELHPRANAEDETGATLTRQVG